MSVTRAVMLVIASALACGGCSGVRPGSLWCERLTEYDGVVAATDNDVRTLPDDYLVIPVIVRLMDQVGDDLVRTSWKPNVVADMFGSAAVHRYSANRLWEQARIRFAVKRVERCVHAPPPPQVHGHPPIAVAPDIESAPLSSSTPGPNQQVYCLAAVRAKALDTSYGVARALNVNLFNSIYGFAMGYGESPYRRGRLPTVWIKAGCVTYVNGWDREDCQRIIAHELGHSLGLKHPCHIKDCLYCPDDALWRGCYPCEWRGDELTASRDQVVECGGPSDRFRGLMRDCPRLDWQACRRAEHRVLHEGEIHSARAAAKAFYVERRPPWPEPIGELRSASDCTEPPTRPLNWSTLVDVRTKGRPCMGVGVGPLNVSVDQADVQVVVKGQLAKDKWKSFAERVNAALDDYAHPPSQWTVTTTVSPPAKAGAPSPGRVELGRGNRLPEDLELAADEYAIILLNIRGPLSGQNARAFSLTMCGGIARFKGNGGAVKAITNPYTPWTTDPTP